MNKIIKDKYVLAQKFLQKSLDEKDPSLSDFYYTQYVETLFKADNDQLELKKVKQ
jgi:hypothetical protein